MDGLCASAALYSRADQWAPAASSRSLSLSLSPLAQALHGAALAARRGLLVVLLAAAALHALPLLGRHERRRVRRAEAARVHGTHSLLPGLLSLDALKEAAHIQRRLGIVAGRDFCVAGAGVTLQLGWFIVLLNGTRRTGDGCAVTMLLLVIIFAARTLLLLRVFLALRRLLLLLVLLSLSSLVIITITVTSRVSAAAATSAVAHTRAATMSTASCLLLWAATSASASAATRPLHIASSCAARAAASAAVRIPALA